MNKKNHRKKQPVNFGGVAVTSSETSNGFKIRMIANLIAVLWETRVMCLIQNTCM